MSSLQSPSDASARNDLVYGLDDRLWGGGSFGAGERVASDGWKPDVARV